MRPVTVERSKDIDHLGLCRSVEEGEEKRLENSVDR